MKGRVVSMKGSLRRDFCEKAVSVKKSLSVKGDADPLTLTSSGGHQSRWYTFHWNAFLLLSFVFGDMQSDSNVLACLPCIGVII